jgi:hypothetical protein
MLKWDFLDIHVPESGYRYARIEPSSVPAKNKRLPKGKVIWVNTIALV